MQPEEEKDGKEPKLFRAELPQSEIYREIKDVSKVLRRAFIALLVIFSVSSISCIILLYLTAFGIASLSDDVLRALIAATVAEIAGLLTMLIIVYRGLFRKQ